MESYEAALEKASINMMKIIKSDPDLYTWFVNYNPAESSGFMYDTHPNVIRISTLVESDGHSGASFAVCMRMCKQKLKQKELL
jgi:hypothetical protein